MYKGKQLENIMPHKRRMVLLSRVVDFSTAEKNLTAEVDITKHSMLFNTQTRQVPAWVGIEYMAQAIAALSGIYNSENNKGAQTLGFIIGARNYKCFTSGFKEGSTLTIKVEQLFLDAEIGSFKCEIFSANREKFASTELNVFQPQDVTQFLSRA